MLEMNITVQIRNRWPDENWTEMTTPGRLRKAEELLEERLRRGQHTDLLDCLQLSDKARIILQDPDTLMRWDFRSKGDVNRAIKNMESLRNNLAHSQQIVTYDWPQIVRLSHRVDQVVAEI